MKYLILLLFLPFFLCAETTSEPVSMMTKAEIEKCSKNKEKTSLRFLIRENGKTGFIDGCGNVVIKPIYDSALEFSEGLARVEKDGKYGYIDKSGKVVIDFYLDYAGFFYNGLAAAEIHGDNAEKFYIDKDNNRYSERNSENSLEKTVMFRRVYDNLVLKESRSWNDHNAFVLGKGLVTIKAGKGFSFYTDYSSQKISSNSVSSDELVESCNDVRLFENGGNIIFVKNDKQIKTLMNSSIYTLPLCRDGITNIVWVKENREQVCKDFFDFDETFFIYNLDGVKIAGFENEYVIKQMAYFEKNILGVALFGGREPGIFDLDGKASVFDEDLKKHHLFSKRVCIGSSCLEECRYEENKTFNPNNKLVKNPCPEIKLKISEKTVNEKFVREHYDRKSGKLISREGWAEEYRSLSQGCFVVVRVEDKMYYLNEDYKAFWSGEIEKHKEEEIEYIKDGIKSKL